uniref:Iron-sulfur clusters transporter ABCB7, mitochondrial n=1 Tax=Ditylenchus dipsaci TaxID=166011 RepID=A0A915EPG9_9BILA
MLNINHFLRPIARQSINQLRSCKKSDVREAVKLFKRCKSGPGANNLLNEFGAKSPSGSSIGKILLRQVWPKSSLGIKRVVILSMGCLISAKCLSLSVPFLFREVINYYNKNVPEEFTINFGSSISTSSPSELCSFWHKLALAWRSVRDIAHKIFVHLHKLDLKYHLDRQTGALSKAVDRGTKGMSLTLNSLVFNIVPTTFEVALANVLLYNACGPEFTYFTMGCLGMYGVATVGITRWRTRFRHEMNQADSDSGNRALDSLTNYETVKYFNNEKLEARRYDECLKQYENASLKTSQSLALLNLVQNSILSVGLLGVMILAAKNKLFRTMTVGDIVLANTMLFQMSIPLNFLGSSYRDVTQGLQDMKTMFSLFDLKSKIVEHPDAVPLRSSKDSSTITFEDVTYIPGSPPILNKLSFEVPTGKKVALVGGSGSGKTTIIRLLYRLYDAESGSISISGQNIKFVTIHSLRKAIAIVPQDSVLFRDSIYYNISYGNPSATEEQIYQAAATADVHNAIMKMPRGYKTSVGERGLKLSGGEKQRVAIARALLKKTDIMIYDEATSSLDALTEENIMSSLKQACSGMTSLFIAHRLATIKDADIIYGGKYLALWTSQTSNNIPVPPKLERESKKKQELLELELEKCCGSLSCTR